MERLKSQRFIDRVTAVIAYVFLSIMVLIVILPVFWVVVTSLKNKAIVYQMPPKLFFTPTFENYIALFNKYPFGEYFLNSLIIAAVTTILGLVIGGLAAYSMARFNTGGDFLKGWVLNNRTMPTVAVLIPFFLLIQYFNLLDTYVALVTTYLTFLLPFCIWMLISFFEVIPVDIEEAALVDGANRMQTFFRIILPMTAPGIASTGILSLLYSWNEFIFALILTGNATRTVPIGVANFMTQRGVEYGELMAAVTLMVIPFLILAFSIRKYLVKGLSYGGVK